MYDKDLFSERLKELRHLTGETHKDFAKSVGCAAATLSAYENGTKNPSLEIVYNIAQKYEASIDWLCGLNNGKTKVQTYADIVKFLFALSDAGIGMTISNSEEDPNLEECDRIIFSDTTLNTFLFDWEKMRSLRSNGVVDDDLYNLWVEKVYKKYNRWLSESNS